MRASGLRRRASAGAAAKRSAIGAAPAQRSHRRARRPASPSARFAAEEIEFWRDAGLYYFVPCVAKEGTIAVLALGRKDTGEPLSSEDIGLLAAVAGQIATALENARLYRQLHLKAVGARSDACLQREHPRVARRRPAGGRPGRSRRSVEPRARAALRRRARTTRSGRPLDDVFDARVRRGCAGGSPRLTGRRDAVAGAACRRAATRRPSALLVNAAVVPLRASMAGDRDRRHDRHRRGRHGARRSSKSSCRSRRRWRRSACWRQASRTR